MDDRISNILNVLEKDIEDGNLVDRLPGSVERSMEEAGARWKKVDANEPIEGDVDIGSLEEDEEWIGRNMLKGRDVQ